MPLSDGYALWIAGCHVESQIADHSAPTWETLADGGCGELTTQLYLQPYQTHHALRKDAPVLLTFAGHPAYSGFVRDFNTETGELVAQGWSDRRKFALDGVGAATLDVGAALLHTPNRGWPVTNPHGISGSAMGEIDGPIYIGDLMARVAVDLGFRWGVDARAEAYIRPDPTVPDWLLAPGAATLGPTSEGQATALAGVYFDGIKNRTLVWGDYVGEEEVVSLTDRGTLTAIQVGVILGSILHQTTGQRAWVNGITVTADDLTAYAGGTRPALQTIVAGQMVRLTGLPVLSAGAMWVDVVIGKTRYTAGASTIYIEPVNTAPRNLVDVLAAS